MDLQASSLVETVLIKYSDGIRTLVVCGNYSSKFVVNKLQEENLSRSGLDDTTRQVDSLLQCYFGLFQCMIHKDDNIYTTEVLELPYPYTLGENESEDDIKKYYPNYKLPKFN